MDVLSLPTLTADHRIAYGQGPFQFGDLWLPAAKPGTRHPLVIFFHGGWWKSAYDLGYAGYVCAALRQAGIATWSLEYRRVGSTGGGWPTTFQDAAAGTDFVAQLAASHPIDLERVITMGHSAGGHLAFWVAGRHHIPHDSALFLPQSNGGLRGAIALAGAVDLRLIVELSGHGVFAHDRHEVFALMGGSPHDLPARYAAGNPGDLLPLQCKQVLIQGTEDDQIPPELPARWADNARRVGSHAEVSIVPGADHFDVVDPRSKAWPIVLKAVEALLANAG